MGKALGRAEMDAVSVPVQCHTKDTSVLRLCLTEVLQRPSVVAAKVRGMLKRCVNLGVGDSKEALPERLLAAGGGLAWLWRIQATCVSKTLQGVHQLLLTQVST